MAMLKKLNTFKFCEIYTYKKMFPSFLFVLLCPGSGMEKNQDPG
jgi:hypothetical protein